MTSVKTVGIEDYIEKVGARERSFLKKKQELMQEALHDTSLPDLDRAVYGLLGSDEKLRDYRKLAEKIGNCANKPIVLIDKTCMRDNPRGQEKIRWASSTKGGIVAGPIEVEFNLNREDPNRIESADFSIPVVQEVSYAFYPSLVHGGREAVYFNDSASKNVNPEDLEQPVNLLVGSIGPHWDTTDQFGNRPGVLERSFGELLIDRKKIYEHPLFNAGIHTLLQNIEQTRSN